MCAPRVTRHTPIRYSSSCHTRWKMINFTLRPDNLRPAENPADHWLEGLVGSLACPDVCRRQKSHVPDRIRTRDSPVYNLVTTLTTLSRLLHIKSYRNVKTLTIYTNILWNSFTLCWPVIAEAKCALSFTFHILLRTKYHFIPHSGSTSAW